MLPILAALLGNKIASKINLSPAGQPSGYSINGNFKKGIYDYGNFPNPYTPRSPSPQSTARLPQGTAYGANPRPLQSPYSPHQNLFMLPNKQTVPFLPQPLQGAWQFPSQTSAGNNALNILLNRNQ